MSRLMSISKSLAFVAFWGALCATGALHAQQFDLGAVKSAEEADGSTRSMQDLFDGMNEQGDWLPFQISFVSNVSRTQLFDSEDLRVFAREWHEMVLPNTSPNELSYRMQQMDSNNLFYNLNDQQNYAGKHRGIRMGYQAEDKFPFGVFAGIHLLSLQWQATGTTSEGRTAQINSSRALVQPLVEDFLYLREIYNYYISEPIEVGTPFRLAHVELGLSKNLGSFVQIGVSALLAPGAKNAITSWHQDLVADLEEPLFELNPGADMSIPMTYCATISARYNMVSFGISQFLQPAPETPTGGDPLDALQYGAIQLGYAF